MSVVRAREQGTRGTVRGSEERKEGVATNAGDLDEQGRPRNGV
jgi:hypothetical protein